MMFTDLHEEIEATFARLSGCGYPGEYGSNIGFVVLNESSPERLAYKAEWKRRKRHTDAAFKAAERKEQADYRKRRRKESPELREKEKAYKREWRRKKKLAVQH